MPGILSTAQDYFPALESQTLIPDCALANPLGDRQSSRDSSMNTLDRLSAHFERLHPATLREPEPGSFIKFPCSVPAGFDDQLWDWDGFFINIHLSRLENDPKPEYFRYWV
jgi:hypothetical protein